MGGLNSSKQTSLKQKSLVVVLSLLPVLLSCAVNTLAYADPAGGSGQVGMMPLAGDMGGRGSETLPSVLRAPTLFAMAMKRKALCG